MNKPLLASMVVFSMACWGCDEKVAPAASKPAKPPAKAAAPSPAPVTPTAPPVAAPSAVAPAIAGVGTISVMNLTFKLPAGWKSVAPSNPMRLAEIQVADASGEAAKVCTVAVSTAGGGVQANIDRWATQVTGADGKPSKAEPKTRTVDGMTVTTVEMTGAFANMGEMVPHTNWTMRGAVVEAPAGLLFLKMTGPAEQMAAAEKAFDSMIDEAKKQ